MSRRFIIDQKITIELCINREIILEPVCNISQSKNVHQNFKETLVFNNFQGFVLKRFQNGSKNLINLQSRISIKNLKSGFNSHISVIHSIFSVVLLWHAGKYLFIYLLSLCNQKGIVFRILCYNIIVKCSSNFLGFFSIW